MNQSMEDTSVLQSDELSMPGQGVPTARCEWLPIRQGSRMLLEIAPRQALRAASETFFRTGCSPGSIAGR